MRYRPLSSSCVTSIEKIGEGPFSVGGGNTLIVNATNFGSSLDEQTVFIGPGTNPLQRCTETTFRTETVLHCVTPAGTGQHLNVQVSVNGRRGPASTGLFSYARPVILTFSTPQGAPTVGGTELRLTGG